MLNIATAIVITLFSHIVLFVYTKVVIFVALPLWNVNWSDEFWYIYLALATISLWVFGTVATLCSMVTFSVNASKPSTTTWCPETSVDHIEEELL